MASRCDTGYDPRKQFLGDFYTLKEVLARYDATAGCTCRIRGLLYQYDGERWTAVAEGIENGGEVFASRYLGMFETADDLLAKYPAPLMGALAVILDSNSWWVYREGVWTDMGLNKDLVSKVEDVAALLNLTIADVRNLHRDTEDLCKKQAATQTMLDGTASIVANHSTRLDTAEENIETNSGQIRANSEQINEVDAKASEAGRVAANAIGKATENSVAIRNADNKAEQARNIARLAYDAVGNLDESIKILLSSNLSENIDTYKEVIDFLSGFLDTDNLKEIMEALDTAAGKNLENITALESQVSETKKKFGALTILPVDGTAEMSMFEGADALFSGVWIVGDTIQFVTSSCGYKDDDYNEGVGTGRHPREDVMFLCGGDLYTYKRSGLSKIVDGEALTNEILTLRSKFGIQLRNLEEKVTETTDKLNEHLNNATDSIEGIGNQLSGKVDKEDGKGLSTNDFTDEYKAKIDNVGEPYKHPETHPASMILTTENRRFVTDYQLQNWLVALKFDGVLPDGRFASECMTTLEGIWWCSKKYNDLGGYMVGIWVGKGTKFSDGIYNSSGGAIGTPKLMYTANGEAYVFNGTTLVEISGTIDTGALQRTLDGLNASNAVQDAAVQTANSHIDLLTQRLTLDEKEIADIRSLTAELSNKTIAGVRVVDGGLALDGIITIGQNLIVNNDAKVDGTLKVGEDVKVDGRIYSKNMESVDGSGFTVKENLVAARDLEVKGASKVQNLRVDGILDAPNVKGANKGIFFTLEKLNEKYPEPEDGWCALVGNTLPAELYIADGGEWVDTETTAGIEGIDTTAIASAEQVQSLEEAVTSLTSSKGIAGGIATLNEEGIISRENLPQPVKLSSEDDMGKIINDGAAVEGQFYYTTEEE